MSDTLPLVITTAGLQPIPPATLRQMIIDLVSQTNPGYTANLPGSLIEDLVSTSVASLSLANQAMIELINSLTPAASNPFLLAQLGAIYGVPIGQGSTTSVYVTFSTSPATPGWIIPPGFIVGDGTHQYVIIDGGTTVTGGVSQPLYALATIQGSWAVPANTVTQIATSVTLPGITVSVTNLTPGIPGTAAQSEADYRVQVLQAGNAACQGAPAKLRTDLMAIPGVQPRLVSVKQNSSGWWEIMVGGGDPYQVAGAIFTGMADISRLIGAVLQVTNISNATQAQVTTATPHGYNIGQQVVMQGVVGMTGVNGVTFVIPPAGLVDPWNFLIAFNSTAAGTFGSSPGAYCSPNVRNITVSLTDPPDLYSVVFVSPLAQNVAIAVTWNTTATNLISDDAVAALAIPALQTYVNGVVVGQPINLFEMQATFQEAVASIIPTPLLTRMVFAVSIDGVGVSPSSGTGIISGDPEGFFYAGVGSVTVARG